MIKSNFIELYEELNTLNEAVNSPEEKAFYDALKKNLLDTENFKKAFKSELTDEEWNKLFDPETGKLRNRGTYGVMKDMDPTLPVTKALKKFWAAQYTTRLAPKTIKEWEVEKEQIRRDAEEADRRSKEAQAAHDLALQMAEEIIKGIDYTLYKKVIEEWKVQGENHDWSNSSWDKVELKIDDRRSSVYIRFGAHNYQPVDTKKSVEENINDFNSRLQEIYAELTVDMSIREANWYSAELQKVIKSGYRTFDRLVFQYSDGTTKAFNRLSLEDAKNIPLDAELVGTRCTEKNGGGYTFSNSYYDEYYSVSASINEEAAKELGVDLHPENFEADDSWGETEYYEVPAAMATKDSKYFKTGMNRWFHYSHTSYGTD
jgi:hypothetical protein